MLTDQEIDRLVKLNKNCVKPIIKWKYQRKSKRCDIHIPLPNDNLLFILYARQNEIDEDNFSCGLKLERPGKDPVTLIRYNGSNHEHTNSIEKNCLDFQFHIHMATERYQDSGYKIDHFAEETNRYNTLQGAIKCLLKDCNITGLTLSDFISQEGLSFDEQ